jgi:hypothetical protein
VDRDIMLVALSALVGGGVAWFAAPLHLSRRGAPSEPVWWHERRAWRRLVAPLVIIAFVTAMWVGWALQEPPESDERLALFDWMFIVFVLALWTRAIARLVRSIVARPALPLAVVGLAAPRIVIDPALRRALDDDALAAALAHEAAHVRHRDPLRIAIAQLATDLQWPWPQPRRRLGVWRELLEQARDDEAVSDGVHPEDLAAAIVEAARWSAHGAGASLTQRHPIEHRILRLLDTSPRVRPPRSRGFVLLVASGVVALTALGFTLGDDLLALVPGVLR